LVSAVLHAGEDGSLTTSASPSRITSPNLPLPLTYGVIENRREILILKKQFLRAATQLPPCRFAVVVNVAKRGLCRLEVNCIVKFSYFLRFSRLVIYVLYFNSVCVLQTCLTVQCGDF
jgi:hypothetical protein